MLITIINSSKIHNSLPHFLFTRDKEKTKKKKDIKDIEESTARRIDFVVKQGDEIIKSFEVTSQTADKTLQMAKEARILKQAKDIGGAFIKDPNTGELLKFASDLVTDIVRL